MATLKPPEFRQIRQIKMRLCRIGQIRQKMGVCQKYFLPARRLSNPPELSKTAIWQRCSIQHVPSFEQGCCLNSKFLA
jgi:hypothetical protein